MEDKDLYAAKTQRHITLVLLYGLFGIVLALIISSFVPFTVNDKILSIANPLFSGVLSLTSGAVGFWIARHRPPSEAGADNDSPSPLDQQPGVKK